jgi:UDP-glucose 4-epimerase
MTTCDISNKEELSKLFSEIEQVDCIFHLAGQTFRKDQTEPQTYFVNNFIGTLNLLECCRVFNVKKFIFSSSIAVYGLSSGQNTPKYLPVDEKHDVNPYDFYDLSKCYSEQLCEFYHRRFGIDCVVLRYSRIYGPGTEKALVFQAAKKALSNDPIEIFGDISTDFVYVDDVVKANILALQINGFEIFNVGSGQETTLDHLCRTIVQLVGSGSELTQYAEPKSRFSLDISKAKSMLSYQPTILEAGLAATVSHIEREK